MTRPGMRAAEASAALTQKSDSGALEMNSSAAKFPSKRRLLCTFLAAISLAACAETTVIWERSYGGGNAAWYAIRGDGFEHYVMQAWTRNGRLRLEAIDVESSQSFCKDATDGLHHASEPPFPLDRVSMPPLPLGFGCWTSVYNGIFYTETKSSFVAPLWLLWGFTTIAPLGWLISRRRFRFGERAGRTENTRRLSYRAGEEGGFFRRPCGLRS